MALREMAREAWVEQQAAIAAEREAARLEQEKIEEAREAQRERAASLVLIEALGEGAADAQLVEPRPAWAPERSTVWSIDGITFVVTEVRSGAGLVQRKQHDGEWNVIGAGNMLIEVWMQCANCGRMRPAGSEIIDLADVGQTIDEGPVKACSVYDPERDLSYPCTADESQIAEANAAIMEREADDEYPRCTPEERVFLNALHELTRPF